MRATRFRSRTDPQSRTEVRLRRSESSSPRMSCSTPRCRRTPLNDAQRIRVREDLQWRAADTHHESSGRLTGGAGERKWRNGTSTHYLLCEGLYGSLPPLQKTGRAGYGAMPGRRAVRNAGCGVEFHRDHRETYGGEYAVALEGFSHYGRGKTGPQPRHGV